MIFCFVYKSFDIIHIYRFMILKNEEKGKNNESKKDAIIIEKQDQSAIKSSDKSQSMIRYSNEKESVTECPSKADEIDEDEYYDDDDEMLMEINESMNKTESDGDVADEDDIVDDEDESGPSSGVRLTEEERENNLFELYKLQRKLLKGLQLTEDDDDDE